VIAPRDDANFTAKRAYGTTEFDREAILASRNDKGAFGRVTFDEVEATEEGFMLHMIERALFGDSSGKLGEVSSVSGAGTSGSNWDVVMTTTGTNAPVYKKRYFPRGAKLDVYSSAGVYQMTIQVTGADSNSFQAVTVSTGADVTPAATDIVYWEGNKDGECVGLASIAPISAGTLYGISQTTNPEFRGLLSDLNGATLAYGDINDLVSDLEDEIDSPNLVIGSHNTVAALKSQAEDQKRYNVAEIKSSDAKIGFKGIEIMSEDGPFPMLSSQMCPEGQLWFMNTKYMQLVMRQDFGWFNWDNEGQGEKYLLADPNKDLFKARYGGYFELFCSKPNSVARVYDFVI
jgi:hypothetical protein